MRNGFKIEANDNVLFVTEQCNNSCLMCCQPPCKINDIEENYQRNLELIHLAPKELKVVCITGGEPTLLGERLIDLLKEIRKYLPDTAIQILSNGRNFIDAEYVTRMHEAAGDNFFIGVPLHSDYEGDHDLIAGAEGAYAETMYGLYNLASEGIEIELRIVMNRLNHRRFPQMSEFIYKNLPFVSWVAFMGMEQMGFAVKNRETIWVEPIDYQEELCQAVLSLNDWGIDTCIYNIPRCLLPQSLWPYAKKSISEWKVRYADCCQSCSQKAECCGLFGTSVRPYVGLKTI